MATFSLNSCSAVPEKYLSSSDKRDKCLPNRWSCVTKEIFGKQHNFYLKRNPNTRNTIQSQSALREGSTMTRTGNKNESGLGIAEYFKEKKLLVAGATGFLGKVLIEKILRATPDVDKIYLVIRAKSQEAGVGILANIINSEVFKVLQHSRGKSYQAFMMSKLVPVVGNICESNIGIKEDLANSIAREVDILINCAANTNFWERYDVALHTNTAGPMHMINFAKKCGNLRLFLQVSTAYVNGQRQGRIMESPFCMDDSIAMEKANLIPSCVAALDIEGEMKLVAHLGEGFGDDAIGQKMIHLGLERAKKYGWQDTYAFTKAMGEMMINYMREEIPTVIIRPSIVESTYMEPFPGWIEGNRMADPVIAMYGKGEIPGFPMDPNQMLDVIPADMVVNATLAAITKHGAAGLSGINIYQVATSVANPLVLRDLIRLFYEHFSCFPCLDTQGRPIAVQEFAIFDSMEEYSSHLHSWITQRLMSSTNPTRNVAGRVETMSRKFVERILSMGAKYEPYAFLGARFDSSNTRRLMECMSEEERNQFGFDVESINWENYIKRIHVPGLRKYVLKETTLISSTK